MIVTNFSCVCQICGKKLVINEPVQHRKFKRQYDGFIRTHVNGCEQKATAKAKADGIRKAVNLSIKKASTV